MTNIIMTRFADLWPVPDPNDTHVVKFSDTRNVDAVYRERTFVVAALARVIFDDNYGSGNPAAWLQHVGEPLEDDWRWVVCIDLGRHVVTWHIHDSELTLFRFLSERADYVDDGHDTDEKYRRIWEYVTGEKA